MEDFTYEIVKDFNFTPKFIKKLKYMYVCQTECGIKLLKPVNISATNINFIYKLKEHIKNNEIFNVDFYYLSNQNLPFVSHNEINYVLTDFLDFPELDFKDINQTKNAIISIAKLHSLCKTFKYDNIDFENIKEINIVENFEKKLNTLIKIKKLVKKQKKLSDFDFLFIKNYDFFYKKCLTSIEVLNKNISLIKNSKNNFMMCHNNLKEENLIFGQKPFITNFENMSISHYIFDISSFILRYIRKKGDLYINLDEILEIYCKINNIQSNLLPILYAILNFPERYIDTCSDFYNKKRCFTPISISNQLEDIINLKLFHQEYISKIIM